MQFRIADTFTNSLARLNANEQKVTKTTAFDLQMNPASPGMKFHRIDKAKDPNFWSIRASDDIRLIVHRTKASLLLCYVGHHDPSYQWASCRKLQTHPKTGAAQLVEVRETVKEITVPKYVEVEQPASPKPPLFAKISTDTLLKYGVPSEWMNDVREATEDTLFHLADHLPSEAAEALLELATGGKPKPLEPVAAGDDPFAHPDAQRRFRVVADVKELQRALDFPWEKWTVFLHPAQRKLVEREYKGPARVSGSAGTGKTIVALHRAVHLARKHPDARVLLTTFSDTLANALETHLKRLVSNEPKISERIDIYAMNAIGRRLYEMNYGSPKIATKKKICKLLSEAAATVDNLRFTEPFLYSEWTNVVDAWQLSTWDEYKDVKRLGRKTRLSESQRVLLWSLFEQVRSALDKEHLVTQSDIFSRVAEHFDQCKNPPFNFAVIDEAQDVDVPKLRFLAALGDGRPDSLFFAGDLGQRIFQQPFSWKAIGVDIRGRSHTLRINYRTSHQIRLQADRLLAPELSDVDGNMENRRGTVSVFNGPAPMVSTLDSQEDESKAVGQWIQTCLDEGFQPHEIGVFVRSPSELPRARTAIQTIHAPWVELDEVVEMTHGKVSLSTMHLAKGLEFRAVVVMACDDEIVPLQSRIEAVSDDSDLEDVYNTERHLLYVACTRARDRLLVTSAGPASEFLDDLQIQD